MNIFATDLDPKICAQQHCDVHVIKMILETAQLLSTCHVVTTGNQVAYKKTHPNHPCGIWMRTSAHNYKWAYILFIALLDEYEFRFGRVHKSAEHKKALAQIPPLPIIGLTKFAQAMPLEHTGSSSCAAYRRYMRAKLREWQRRPKPMRTTFTRRAVPSFLRNVCKPVDMTLAFGHY